MSEFFVGLQHTPLAIQLLFWTSWLGVASALCTVFFKTTNNWPVFLSVWVVALIALLPQVVQL